VKNVVSFSGGRTSAYLCYLLKQKHKNTDFVFMDTGAEHGKTYEFIKNCNKNLKLDITCIRGDFSLPLGGGVGFRVVHLDECRPDLKPYKEMMAKYGVPYIGGMFCTDRMKLVPYRKYCTATYGAKNYKTWLGIRADEPARLVGDNKDKSKSAYRQLKSIGMCDYTIYKLFVDARTDISLIDNYGLPSLALNLLLERIKKLDSENIHYLAEISDFEKEDINLWWSGQEFDLGIDDWLGNCVFCPKKSNLKLAAAARDEQKMFAEFKSAIESDHVRNDEKTGSYKKMYRGKSSLGDVIALFDGSSTKNIKQRILGHKSTATGSCSESCESDGSLQESFDF